MRKFVMFSIAVILMACLFAGCGGGDDDDNDIVGPGGSGEYAWLASMQPGSWATHTNNDAPGATETYKWLKDTWEGTPCFVMEMEMYMPGEGTTVTQVWLKESTGEPVLFLVEISGEVVTMDLTQAPDVTEDMSDELEPEAQKVRDDTYTTPTGKTVNVAVYTMDTPSGVEESWTSDEVPFWNVKEILNGEIQSQLYDFSFSGAERSITKQEALDAEPMGFPDIPGGGGIPDGGGGIPDGGGGGTIVITVGAGARPTISVSQPIHSLLVMQGVVPVWVFESPNMGEANALSFAGPFQYGVAPNGANETFPNAPDMIAGQSYIIQVTAINNAGIPLTGTYMFTR